MRFALPALLLLAAAPALAQETRRSCVDVRIGEEQYFNCLNEQLRRAVPARRFSSADAAYTATSPAHELGGFNLQATRQTMGNALGRSHIPQRVPQSFGPPPFAR
jgi:hypothetical protein